MPDDGIPRSIIFIVILILSAGFFAGSETAFSFCNRIRIKMLADDGDKRAKRVIKILDDFDRTVVTLLIAINIIYISVASIATVLFVRLIGDTGSIVATAVITLLVFMFSETIPKNIARTNSDAYALAVSMPITFFRVILKPLALLFTFIGNAAKKLIKSGNAEPSVTVDEFASYVDTVEEEGLIEPEETEIIKSAIEFGEIIAGEVMTPVARVVGVPFDAGLEKIKDILVREKYSRFPVYYGNIDNIIGILQSKNALWSMMNGISFDIKSNITKPYFVGKNTPLNEVFEGMGARHTHFAVVRSETDATIGIITMEDILEEIVGEIYDEDDLDDPPQPQSPEEGGITA